MYQLQPSKIIRHQQKIGHLVQEEETSQKDNGSFLYGLIMRHQESLLMLTLLGNVMQNTLLDGQVLEMIILLYKKVDYTLSYIKIIYIFTNKFKKVDLVRSKTRLGEQGFSRCFWQSQVLFILLWWIGCKKEKGLRELKSDLCTSNITLSANSRSRTYARENPFKRDYYFQNSRTSDKF